MVAGIRFLGVHISDGGESAEIAFSRWNGCMDDLRASASKGSGVGSSIKLSSSSLAMDGASSSRSAVDNGSKVLFTAKLSGLAVPVPCSGIECSTSVAKGISSGDG